MCDDDDAGARATLYLNGLAIDVESAGFNVYTLLKVMISS